MFGRKLHDRNINTIQNGRSLLFSEDGWCCSLGIFAAIFLYYIVFPLYMHRSEIRCAFYSRIWLYFRYFCIVAVIQNIRIPTYCGCTFIRNNGIFIYEHNVIVYAWGRRCGGGNGNLEKSKIDETSLSQSNFIHDFYSRALKLLP